MELTKAEFLNCIKESLRRILIKKNAEWFDLSSYLDTIPEEELKNQYEGYGQYKYINGFDIIGQVNEDIKNKISSALEAKQHIMKKCGLKDWQVVIKSENNNVEIIIIYAGILKNTNIIKKEMLSNGFFDSTSWFARKKFMIWRAIKFEPQNQLDLTDEATRFGVLYHLTLSSNSESIQNKGITPAHGNSYFKFPNRVYVIKGDTPMPEIESLGEQLCNKDKNNEKNNGEYTLYKINTASLPETVRFYGDPNYQYGYFTYDLIPPGALSILKTFVFDTSNKKRS